MTPLGEVDEFHGHRRHVPDVQALSVTDPPDMRHSERTASGYRIRAYLRLLIVNSRPALITTVQRATIAVRRRIDYVSTCALVIALARVVSRRPDSVKSLIALM